jgi:tRNA-2-methylthio-N6-dimethylallyladenosine synthase
MSRKLYLETFGCQMNVLDSELVLSQLRTRGFTATDDRDDADVVIYNTCSVREHAEQKVWSRLGELRETKQEKPDLVVGVIGCMAERDGLDIYRKFPHVDLLCGPGELDKLPAMVLNAVTSVATQAAGAAQSSARADRTGGNVSQGNGMEGNASRAASGRTPPTRQTALLGNTTRRSGTREAAEDTLELLDLSRAVSPGDDVRQSYVRITRGCNKFCTYCVVPYTRGAEVHRPPTNIIDEVKMLVDAGSIEVTLLGQTINHYAYQHGDGRTTTFADLLYAIHEAVPALPRLRFVTSYPRDFTDLALQAMRDCPRICRYLHAPAQHGADRILKLMNRGYTVEMYDRFVERARAYMPDVSIASDFIVGFPTETDAEFDQTVELLRRSRFKNSFIFKYSPRPGTVAIDRFADDIPDAVKKQRNNALLAAQGEVTARLNREMVGQTVEVMVEGVSKLVSRQKAYPASNVQLGRGFGDGGTNVATPTTPGPSDAESQTQLIGRTRGDQVVAFPGTASMKGRLLDVKIVDARQMTLFGEIV